MTSRSRVNVQTFTAGSGTWTKPAWAKTVQLFCFGGGGGGGSGRKGAAGSVRCGGGPGGASGFAFATLLASELPDTLAVTVGAAGTSGAAQATNSTSGVSGGTGGA